MNWVKKTRPKICVEIVAELPFAQFVDKFKVSVKICLAIGTVLW
jgi:hypothetical protein